MATNGWSRRFGDQHLRGLLLRSRDVPKSVEATFDGLFDQQRVFYEGMTEERLAQVLNETFVAS